jgi:UDP-N-acetylglucosamine--N-acetylmuramyl-(pentapeptide) pyrophosphoryl-undecaprenol N-acetylglucosamine transferase
VDPFLLLIVLLVLVGAGGALSWRWRRLASREARIVLTGGGTGGHVNPSLAIAEGIRRREPASRFIYVGVRDKAEAVIVQRVGYPLHFVLAMGFPGLRPSLGLLRFVVCLWLGMTKSLWILVSFAPRWIVATGGYVSAPIIFTALLLRLLRIAPTKVFVHEQNSVPGQFNAVIGRWADRVLLTFPQTLALFPGNGVVVGYPVRHSIVLKSRTEALANLPFEIPPERQVVFVFGGSQGSRSINRGIVDALRTLLPYRDKLFVIHGMGLLKSAEYNAAEDTAKRLQSTYRPEELELLETCYARQDYFHNISDVYSISDLIVCRSGAGSLNEISLLAKPALLIPKANLPGDHQVMNARAMKHAGAVEILFEDTTVDNGQVLEKVGGEILAERILHLLRDPQRLREMSGNSAKFLRKRATDRILSELYGDKTYNNGVGLQTMPHRPLMSNQQLLRVLDSAYRSSTNGFDPLVVVEDADDLVFYQHRAAALLTRPAWQDRNLGVKLIGLTRYQEEIPTLLHMLVDRTPASWSRRLFGGDFEQVGFIRRNIAQALQVMSCFNAEVERHLLMALEDPYFEVRAQACGAAAHFSAYLAGKEVWLQALLQHLQDESFEVVMEAARALGELGVDGRALDALLELRNAFRWQVRDAALRGIKRLLERHIICPSPELLTGISRFVLTATDFRPQFSIKDSYHGIEEYCRQRSDKKTGCTQALLGSPLVTGKRQNHVL